jgi:hypothetical protein
MSSIARSQGPTNEFIYPYSSQYISRLNRIALKRNTQNMNQQKDVLNSRASGGFTIPVQPGEILIVCRSCFNCLILPLIVKSNFILTNKIVSGNEQRGRSGSVNKRSDSPYSVSTKSEKNSTTTKSRSNSVDLKRQRTPNRALSRPVLQQHVSVFDGLFIILLHSLSFPHFISRTHSWLSNTNSSF